MSYPTIKDGVTVYKVWSLLKIWVQVLYTRNFREYVPKATR